MSLRVERRPPTPQEASDISQARQRLQLSGLDAAPMMGGCAVGVILLITVPGLIFAYMVNMPEVAWWIGVSIGVLVAIELALIVRWRVQRARMLRAHAVGPPDAPEQTDVWHFQAGRAWVLEDDAGNCTAVLDLGDDGMLAMPALEIAPHLLADGPDVELHLCGSVLQYGNGPDEYIITGEGSTMIVETVRYREPVEWTDAERAAFDLHMDCERGHVRRCRLADLPQVLRDRIESNNQPQDPLGR